jgi:hypothetical protein
MGKNVATSATIAPISQLARTGVPCAPVCASPCGSSPSRAIAKATRICPSSSTMTTVVRPASAPTAMIVAAQFTPFNANAVASVARVPSGWVARSVYGTIPVSTRATAT